MKSENCDEVTASFLELVGADDGRRAARLLYDRCAPGLRGHLGRMLPGSDVDDVLQDTLVAAWEHRSAFAGHASVCTWLHTIAVNKARNHLRAARSGVRGATRTMDDEESGRALAFADAPSRRPDRTVAEREILAQIFAALDELDSDISETFAMSLAAGLPHAEIARELGVEVGTVATRINRARAFLSKKIPGATAAFAAVLVRLLRPTSADAHAPEQPPRLSRRTVAAAAVLAFVIGVALAPLVGIGPEDVLTREHHTPSTPTRTASQRPGSASPHVAGAPTPGQATVHSPDPSGAPPAAEATDVHPESATGASDARWSLISGREARPVGMLGVPHYPTGETPPYVLDIDGDGFARLSQTEEVRRYRDSRLEWTTIRTPEAVEDCGRRFVCEGRVHAVTIVLLCDLALSCHGVGVPTNVDPRGADRSSVTRNVGMLVGEIDQRGTVSGWGYALATSFDIPGPGPEPWALLAGEGFGAVQPGRPATDDPSDGCRTPCPDVEHCPQFRANCVVGTRLADQLRAIEPLLPRPGDRLWPLRLIDGACGSGGGRPGCERLMTLAPALRSNAALMFRVAIPSD